MKLSLLWVRYLALMNKQDDRSAPASGKGSANRPGKAENPRVRALALFYGVFRQHHPNSSRFYGPKKDRYTFGRR